MISVLLLLIILKAILIHSQVCDMRKMKFREGNLGKTGDFPWLGILRVMTHDEKRPKFFLTGIALVRHNYAIGNANDIAKLSPNQLRHDSKGLFLVQKDKVWTTNVKESILHPEYEYSTTSTIAIIIFDDSELDYTDIPSPTPACLHQRNYNFSANSGLYLIRYTDEHKLLVKVAHKMKYVPTDLCFEYYKRAEFLSNDTWPAEPFCAYATQMKNTCFWDNAMAVVHSHNGTAILVAIGVFGPGCAVPSRYIKVYPYVNWILSIIKMQGEEF